MWVTSHHITAAKAISITYPCQSDPIFRGLLLFEPNKKICFVDLFPHSPQKTEKFWEYNFSVLWIRTDSAVREFNYFFPVKDTIHKSLAFGKKNWAQNSSYRLISEKYRWNDGVEEDIRKMYQSKKSVSEMF